MAIEEWQTQAKKGTLELCILGLMEEKDYYGYQLINVLANWEAVSANENTIYPLLRRLTKEGYLESYWQDNQELPRRKYYRLTLLGRGYLAEMTVSWHALVQAIADIQLFKEGTS